MPVGYYGTRNLAAMAGVGLVLFGLLGMNWWLVGAGAVVLGWFAFFEK
jgi:hypothetical protein